MNLNEQVGQSLAAMNWAADNQIHPTQQQVMQERIIDYLFLIKKWNKSYNLTAIKTIEEMVSQHIMDSLSVINYINGPQVVDVGTGAGLPGIPIAIARPDWHILLIESNKKKTAFLQQTKIELKLDNITIVADRVENTILQERIDTITSRAFAQLGIFLETTQHLNATNNEKCHWIAMKGNCAETELKTVNRPFYIENVISLNVPGLDKAKRKLILIKQEKNQEKNIKELHA